MDDSRALAREYSCAIKSMQDEVTKLAAQLAQYSDSADTQNSPQDLNDLLETTQQEIENLNTKISEIIIQTNSFKANQEWLTSKFS